MNPLGKGMQGAGMGNNPLNMIIQMMNGGGNPKAIAQQIMQQNPQARQFMEQMKNTANAKNPKEMAMQIAKQQGIDPDQLLQLVSKFGRK